MAEKFKEQAIIIRQEEIADEDVYKRQASLYMAQLYEVKGEDEKAAGLYKEYIDENQDNPTALVCLGGMELEKGNYDSAINLSLIHICAKCKAEGKE